MKHPYLNKGEKIVEIDHKTSIVVKKGVSARDAKARYIKKMKELEGQPKESKRALQQSNSGLDALLNSKS